MTKIVLASADSEESAQIVQLLGSSFEITVIQSVNESPDDLEGYDLMVLDQNFTDFQGIDFLMTVVSKNKLPVLMLSPEDDPNTASEAMNSGAYNYVVKEDGYTKVLSFAIRDSIRHFSDLKAADEQVATLKKNVQELEMKLVSSSSETNETNETNETKSSKPRTLLKDVIETLKSQEINLPVYSEISKNFKELVGRGASVADICNLLRNDSGITTKLISVSNSPYYRSMTPIKTLDQAISRIGIAQTVNYVELIANRALYMNANSKYKAYLEKLWEHSLTCGFMCQEISKTILYKNPMELFSLGMLHDIGKLLLIHVISELENREIYDEDIPEQEWSDIVQNHHGQFGSALLKVWKLPEAFSISARYHEQPDLAPDISKDIWVVNLANLMAKSLGYSDIEEKVSVDFEHSRALEELGLSYFEAQSIRSSVVSILNDSLIFGQGDENTDSRQDCNTAQDDGLRSPDLASNPNSGQAAMSVI